MQKTDRTLIVLKTYSAMNRQMVIGKNKNAPSSRNADLVIVDGRRYLPLTVYW
jgi:hypothetical protein